MLEENANAIIKKVEASKPLEYKVMKTSDLYDHFSIESGKSEKETDRILSASLERLQNKLKGEKLVGFLRLPLEGAEIEGYCHIGEMFFKYIVIENRIKFELAYAVVG